MRHRGHISLAAALGLVPVCTVVAIFVWHGERDVLLAVGAHELQPVSDGMYTGEQRKAHLFAAAIVARAAVEFAVDAMRAAAVDL